MGLKLGYQPALDGIRALSITLVLVFHLGASWLPGGYLGVSVFFTLSGFLITSLLLDERRRTGGIDVRAFYLRRVRRLLPASLLCLGGIAVLASIGTIAERADLRAGVLGAVFQVANWEALLGDRSYGDLFLAPSPVDHFWSLAIEEQFYWVWPLAIAGLTALAGRRGVATALATGFVVLGVGAVATAELLGGDAAYFASWSRFAEIVAGAALAGVLAERSVPRRLSLLAPVALAAIVALAVVTPAGRGWAYGGGLPVFALLSVALIAGVQAHGPVTRLLAREPLPAIGRVSYGLYLFHWPVFTIMDGSSAVVKLAVTAAVTLASYHLVERPVRARRVLAAPAGYLGAAAFTAAAVAVASVALIPTVERRSSAPVVITAALTGATETPSVPAEAAPASLARDETAPKPAEPAIAAEAPAPRPAVVALFGDSVADWLLRDASPSFARSDVTLIDAAVQGCDGAADIPDARGRGGQLLPLPGDCRPWPVAYPEVVENEALPVDTAVLVIGNAPIVDRNVDGRWISPCEDMTWYEADVAARVEYLRPHVGEVVLALPSWGGEKASFLSTDDHLERMACIRRRLTALTDRLGVAAVDLASVLCPAGPTGACSDLREADGTHVDPEDAPFVLGWLLDEVSAR